MNNQIVCPHCKQSIPLSDALSHEIKEKYRQILIEDRKKTAAEYQKKLEEAQKEILATATKKAEQQLSLQLKDSENEREELKQQNKTLQEQLLELTKTLRQLKTDSEQKQLEFEKKLAQEEEKIREDAKKKTDEEYRLKMLENEKKLADALRVNDELKRKLEQGSQQTQGEVLELELESLLKTEFPFDEIKPVAKGVRGGDLVQVVRNNAGKACGSIIWESKRTKTWGGDWIQKLKDDQRQIKAELAVIVSEIMPVDLKNFGEREGVWITNFTFAVNLAYALRKMLLEVSLVRAGSDGKKEKMEVLYNYIYGTEFRQRIEAIMEAFTSLQSNMEKEKRWFAAKWAKEEKDIRKVLDNTMGLSGDLQSITGKSLPDVDVLLEPQTEEASLLEN